MLIPCPDCSRDVSDHAAACPNCGFPIGGYPLSYTESGVDDKFELSALLFAYTLMTPREVQDNSVDPILGLGAYEDTLVATKQMCGIIIEKITERRNILAKAKRENYNDEYEALKTLFWFVRTGSYAINCRLTESEDKAREAGRSQLKDLLGRTTRRSDVDFIEHYISEL